MSRAAARPRRSVLYRLGNDPHAYADAHRRAVDVLLFDLEDSVAPVDKDAARARLVAALKAGGFAGQERLVRINGLDTPWGEADLHALRGVGIDGVMLAKAESAAQMRAAERLLADDVDLWAMIETPRGALAAAEIAASCPRMTGLAIGLGDLSRGMRGFRRAASFRFPVLAALSTVLLAARAQGLAAIDSAFRDPRDPDGFRAACLESRELGYDGKALTDPALAPIAEAAFSPDAAELDWAARVQAALDAAAPGTQPTVDGQLIEPGYADQAAWILATRGWRRPGAA